MNHFPEDFFPPVRLPLINEKRSFCEGHFTAKGYFEAFKDMAAEKSPGTDGLPCEFYKIFSEDIEEILSNALNFSYEIGYLTISQR